MTVTVIFAEETDFHIKSESNTSLSDALNATGSAFVTVDTTGVRDVGVDSVVGYDIFKETWIEFNTSAVGTDTVSDVLFEVFGVTDYSTVDTTINVLADTWDGVAAASQWKNPVALAALTKIGSFNTSAFTTGYMSITSLAAFNDHINGSGNTAIMFAHPLHESSSSAVSSYITIRNASYFSTIEDPKLTITHAAGGGGGPTVALTKIGGSQVDGVRIGSSVVDRIYLGTNLVFDT